LEVLQCGHGANTLLSEYNLIHKLFEQQVEKTPDNIAVKYDQYTLTYKELNIKVNKLAHFLITHYDLVNNKLINLFMDRSENLLIAILAVLKTGCAYVPIDTSYPDRRIAYIVNDCQSAIILTNQIYENKLNNLVRQKIIENSPAILPIDRDSIKEECASQSPRNLDIEVSHKDLAYVIYTSGTTGDPKGVMIEHAGVVNRIKWMNERFPLRESDIVLQKTPYSFDVSVWELLWASWYGACTIFAKPDRHKDPKYIVDLIVKELVTIVHFVPSMLNVFSDTLEFQKLNNIDVGACSSLRYIFCSGEVLTLSQVNTVKGFLPQTQVHNLYGPTEASIDATHFDCNNSEIERVCIGKPISNMKCYVLDENQNPLPAGQIGELCIAGVGLARGYLNKEVLTQKNFIDNPFQSDIEKKNNQYARIYKTGDLARLSPMGELEYMGRNDFQVKLRGFRIELGEIENTISDYPGIKQTVVMINEKNNSKTLVGYYVSDGNLDEDDLKQHIQSKLPEYMVPNIFMELDNFQLTENGKLDRKKLPKPIFSEEEQYVSPRNNIELKICQIWSELLGIEAGKLGVNDDFFKLGGDSIVSIQIVSRLRQDLKICISVKDIFVCKNIATLYDAVLKDKTASNKKIDLKTEQGLLHGQVGLLPIQSWFLKNSFKNKNYYNQSFSIKVPSMALEDLQTCLLDLIQYHDSFRLRYKREDGVYSQYYDKKSKIPPMKTLDVRSLGEEGSETFNANLQALLAEWQSHFNLDVGPLHSVVYLYGYLDGTARVHFSLHHLIVDSVSWRILAEDFKLCYEKRPLPSKSSSYRQWVSAVENYSAKNSGEKEYWQGVLRDYDDGFIGNISNKRQVSNNAEIRLTKKQTISLLRNSNTIYHTEINDLLLAALSYALKGITNHEVNYIVLEGHGREEIDAKIDITKTLGWFTTLFPVRLAVKESLGETIKSTKEMLRDIPNKGIGYGALFGYDSEVLPKINFNYLGLVSQERNQKSSDNLWQIISADESKGYSISRENQDIYLININGLVIGGELRFDISSKLNVESTNTIAKSFKDSLLTLIDHIANQNRSYLTCSDIANIITQEQLDKLQKNKEIEAVYSANNLQQGFVYHALNQGDIDDSYFVQFLWEYHTDLDISKLKLAWECAQRKFGSLRLRFSWEAEEIIQIIDKETEFTWFFYDFSNTPNLHDQAIKIKEIQKCDRENRYKLDEGGLFRVYLIKQSHNFYTCLFSHHHAILDGWGNVALLDFIHKTYLDLMADIPVSSSVDKSYESAQSYLHKTRNENVDYWIDYISDIENTEDLRGLLSADAVNKNLIISECKRVTDSKDHSLIVKGDLFEKLKDVCVNQSVTLNAIMQYAWHKILKLYGNTEKTVVGTTFSGRNIPISNVENSVGLYINTLPFCVDHSLSKSNTIIEVIKKIQDETNEVRIRSNVSLAKLQKGGKRLFNSLFEYEKFAVTKSNKKNQEILNIKYKQSIETQDYPLGVVIYEESDYLKFRLKYAGELFDEETIEKIILDIEKILIQVANHCCNFDNSVTVLSDFQHKKIVSEWNDTVVSFQEDKTLSQLFEEQTMRTPNKIAVLLGEKKLTYRELDEKSNQLAHYLKEIGIGPDNLVAICLDRSIEMIIAMLGILKAGGAYVPIDPRSPLERFEYILDSSKISIILTDIATENNIPATFAMIVLLDDEPDMLSEFPTSAPNSDGSPNNLAYVIYTSGTTGTPKGVMIEHKGVVSLIASLTRMYGIDKGSGREVILNFSSFIFDASVEQIFLALLNGNQLLLMSNDLWLDHQKFYSYLDKNKVTHIHATPTFLEQYDFSNITSLRRIVSGGDIFSKELFEKLATRENISIINEYGPTETTITSLVNIVGDDNGGLGKPIDNTRCYVLDNELNPLPVGAVGELYIAGVGLARGYLNNPELTEEKFISNPFQTKIDVLSNRFRKMYKTGDLVAWKSNGELRYLGRNDFQVKIRGYRIELGEIEDNIAKYKGVTKNIVVVKGENNSKSLVCYYLGDQQVNKDDIKYFLQSKLPDFMIPHHFVWLEKYPLLPSGKLDRQALPEPAYFDEDNHIAPRNDTEKEACKIWSDVLGIASEKIGINDDFFRLGGDSISAIKLVTKLNKQYQANVTIADIFKKKSIKAILNSIEKNINKFSIISKSNLKKENQILSFAQERLWFINEYEGGSNAYNIPIFFKLRDVVDIEKLVKCVKSTIERHESLRTLYKKTDDGGVYQEIVQLDESLFTIPITEVKKQSDLDKQLKKKAHLIFDLSLQIPVNVNIYRLLKNRGNEENYLCIVIHHIAHDGWSSNILVQEISTLYKSENIDKTILEMPQHEITYKDFAIWQRAYLENGKLNEDLEYWKTELKDYVKLNLVLDKKRPENVNYGGSNRYFELSEDISASLREFSKNLKVSLYSILLSAFYLLLKCVSCQSDIVIGFPIANRHYPGVENLIGFFVNSLPLRAKIDDTLSLKQFIQEISEKIVQAQKHQDLPFERLVQELELEKDVSTHPIFQHVFGFQSFGEIALKECTDLFSLYASKDCSYDIAKTDLSIYIDDTAVCLKGVFNYSTSIFNANTIANYQEIYFSILNQILSSSGKKINSLSYINELNFNKLIYQNNQAFSQKNSQSVINIFHDQVEKDPLKPALCIDNIEINYVTLRNRVYHLSLLIINNSDIQQGDNIAVVSDKKEDLIVSVLAILRAKCMAIPIDKNRKKDHISLIMRKADPKIVITGSSYVDINNFLEEKKLIFIDEINFTADVSDSFSIVNDKKSGYAVIEADENDSIKLILFSEIALLNASASLKEKFLSENTIRLMLLHHDFFDACILEVVSVLMAGLTLDLSYNNEVNSILMTSGEISEVFDNNKFPNLRLIIFNNIFINYKKYKDINKKVKIYSYYGPIELGKYVLEQNIDHLVCQEKDYCSPIKNVSAYVLDEHLNPLPYGVVGFLYIGGSLVPGYIDDSDSVEKVFIENPFYHGQDTASRFLYKTKLLARWNELDSLEIMGVSNQPLSLYGYKEIVGKLNYILYLSRKNKKYEVRNCKYADKTIPVIYCLDEVDEIKLWLDGVVGDFFPKEIIPSYYYKVDSLLNTEQVEFNKICENLESSEDRRLIPRNEIDQCLCEIWSELLDIHQNEISIDDGFFKLGGSSISALRLSMIISNEYNIEFTVLDVFNNQKICEMSDKIINMCSNKKTSEENMEEWSF